MTTNSRRIAAPQTQTTPSSFADLGLEKHLVRALDAAKLTQPTPVQRQAIPVALTGADLVACAQTGTGKTAAFLLPLLQRLGQPKGYCRGLIVTPTRELALQIGAAAETFGRYGQAAHTVIYGGTSQRRQAAALRRSPDFIVATPGRLLDLMGQGLVALGRVELLVLDEADTMLDMGFIRDIRRIVSQIPRARQTLLFSATMPNSIDRLVRDMTRAAQRIDVSPQSTPADTVSHSVVMVNGNDKGQLLKALLDSNARDRTLVFTRTKHGANRIAQQLSRSGISAAAIHGNRSQAARERALGDFRTGTTPVLVATDVAARGIDVPNVALVVNFDLPAVPESYVHRIGRTGRAGATGRAISFCTPEERNLLSGVERLLRRRLDVDPTPSRANLGVSEPLQRPLPRGRHAGRVPPRGHFTRAI